MSLFRITGLIMCTFLLGCTKAEAQHISLDVAEIVRDIEDQFAPDRRIAWWDILVEEGEPILLRGETNLPLAKEELLRRLDQAKVRYRDSITLYFAKPGLVNISVCNIRSKPKHSAELSTQSLLGTPLKVYKEDAGWYYVQTPEGYLGWLDAGGLVQIGEEAHRQWRENDKVVVREYAAFVKQANDGAIISDVVEGNILRRLGLEGDKVQVAFPDGRAGVIEKSAVVPYQDFIKVAQPLLPGILATAKRFMGRPYLWGGTSARAMDCSGFTKTVFYLNGLELPRDASQQVRVGIDIDTDTTLKNLEIGDFLFFGRKASAGQRERITHVGIYLGDGKMIHASEMVRIQSLRRGDPDFAEERLQTLVRAKRMLVQIGANGVIPIASHPEYNNNL